MTTLSIAANGGNITSLGPSGPTLCTLCIHLGTPLIGLALARTEGGILNSSIKCIFCICVMKIGAYCLLKHF